MNDFKLQISVKGMLYVFIVSAAFFMVLTVFVFVNVTTRRQTALTCTTQNAGG